MLDNCHCNRLRAPHKSDGSPRGPSTCTSSLGGSLMLRRCALGSSATSADAALRGYNLMGAALRVSPEPRRKEMSLDARHPIHTHTLLTQTCITLSGTRPPPNNNHGPLGSVSHTLSVSVGFTRGCAGSVTTVHALGGCSPLLVFARQGKFCFFGWFYTAVGFASQGKVGEARTCQEGRQL